MTVSATFPPTSGTFAGMTEAELRAALSSVQHALIDLAIGAKTAVVSYSQGDGQRMITYTKASEKGLRDLIRELNAALGQGTRRAIGIGFA